MKIKTKIKRAAVLCVAIVMSLVGLPVNGATYTESPKVNAQGDMLPLDKGQPLNLLPNAKVATFPLYQTVVEKGVPLDVHFAPRTDGRTGRGTADDPYSATTFEATAKTLPVNTHMTLAAGIYPVTPANNVGLYLKSGWTIEGEGEGTVIQLQTSLAGIHYGAQVLGSPYNAPANGVTLRNLVIDGNWPGIGSTADDGTGGSGTVTDGVTSIGFYTLQSPGAKFDKSYIGRTVTGAGIPANLRIIRIPSTTIAAGSDGATLPQATINVENAVDFKFPGTLFVSNGSGFQTISYTGKTTTSLTGCSGGVGMISKGQLVSTVTQLVMNGNALADASGVTFTFGGQKRVAVCGPIIYGSNNTVENVHVKNLYGSLKNSNGPYANESYESFAGILYSPPAGPPATNNHIRNVLVDNFYGDYAAGWGLAGISAEKPLTNSTIEYETVVGWEWPFMAGFFHTGLGAWVENCQYIGANLRFSGYAYYIDTGSQKNCLVTGLQSYGLTGGLYLLAAADPTWTLTDLTFSNCQFDIMNMQLLTGDAVNAIRVNATHTTNLKINHCRFMQRSGGYGTLGGHALLLVNTTNTQLYYNQFDTDGVYVGNYQYKLLSNPGMQAFYNRTGNGGLLTAQEGLADNTSFGANDISVIGQMTAGNISTPGTFLGNGSTITQIQAKNIEATIKVVNDADYVIKDDDYIIEVANLTAPRTISLPSASANSGKFKYVKDASGLAGTHTIDINPNVEGSNQTITTNYGYIGFRSNGTVWLVQSKSQVP